MVNRIAIFSAAVGLARVSSAPADIPTCEDGTNCGGTNLWTTWGDTSLPDSNYTNPGKIPWPKSTDLVDWEFKSGANPGYGSGNYKDASADTFFPTWAADGNMYTGFTDGNVLDDVTGVRTNAKSEGHEPYGWAVRHGQAAIIGDDPFTLKLTKVRSFGGDSDGNLFSAYPYDGRFPSGSLVYKGTWWMGSYFTPPYGDGPLKGGLLGPLVDFRYSTNMGETWVEPRLNCTSLTDNLFNQRGPIPKTDPIRVKFTTAHWVDFGQELEHSPDGKAYMISHGASSPSSSELWMLGDSVYMARVTPTIDDIADYSKWEFYAGGTGSAAKWVYGDVSKAVPFIEWTNHTGSTTMTYFAGIQKYVVTVNTATTYPVMDNGNFDTYYLESDSITGPWKYVTYMKEFGPQVYFSNHPSKFLAKQADTAAKTFDAFLMYSANYDPATHVPNPPNSAYHMNLQQARFSLSSTFAAKLQSKYAAALQSAH